MECKHRQVLTAGNKAYIHNNFVCEVPADAVRLPPPLDPVQVRYPQCNNNFTVRREDALRHVPAVFVSYIVLSMECKYKQVLTAENRADIYNNFVCDLRAGSACRSASGRRQPAFALPLTLGHGSPVETFAMQSQKCRPSRQARRWQHHRC